MDENLNVSQLPSQEPKKNSLLEGVEFGVGGALLGITTFLLMLFVLNYFNIISLSLVFPKYFGFLPHRAQQGVTLNKVTPSQTSQQSRRASPTPILPISLSSPLVKGVSVYYRLSGVVGEIQPQENGDLSIKLISSDEITYPQSFILSSTQTIVSKKGKGLGGVSLSTIKEGDKLELVYTVDLKTNQSLINQVQLVEVPE